MKTNKVIVITVMALVMAAAAGPSLFAQRKVTIKLASPLPQNSPWGAALDRAAADWAKATNGEVRLQIFHNGVKGGEAQMMRGLKSNDIQAAIFTSMGLSLAVQEVMTLSVPFLIHSNAEMDMILANERAGLEKKFEDQGFYMMAWAKAGWVRFFSRQPVKVPQDLKKQKLASDPDQLAIMQALKAMGYQVVPVAINETLTSLTTGMIDAVYESPLAVGAFQIFGMAKNMANFNVAPFMGGLLLNGRAWKSIPDKYKSPLLEITRRLERELDTSLGALDEEAVTTMIKYGLVVNDLTPEETRLWYAESERVIPGLLGDVSQGAAFDRGFYNRITALLDEYRKTH